MRDTFVSNMSLQFSRFITWEEVSKVFSNQCPGLLLGSSNLAIPSGPSLSSGTGEGI